MPETVRDQPRGSSTAPKLFVVLLGLVTAFLLLEMGLRVFGYVYDRYTRHAVVSSGSSATVLCLGDSYTNCPGVPRDESYPAQLQRLLDAAHGEGAYTVVNLGVNGQNTTRLLNTLEENLSLYQPRLVLLMTGGANTWDLDGFNRFSEGTGLLSDIRGLFGNLRVVRLVRLAFLGDRR